MELRNLPLFIKLPKKRRALILTNRLGCSLHDFLFKFALLRVYIGKHFPSYAFILGRK